MLLQPLKLLKTSCISTCIGFKNERKIRKNSVNFLVEKMVWGNLTRVPEVALGYWIENLNT